MNRRQAAVGYVTFRVGKRIARRKLRRAMGAVRPGHADGGWDMKQARNARAAADRAAALVEQVRPIVTRAMNDPELHEALRQAFSTGRDVKGEISGKKPSKAARTLAKDRKLHKRVETSAQDLQRAVSHLVETPRGGRLRRLVGRLAVVGAVAGGVVVLLRKLKRGGHEPPY